jgi:hypothetical protein
MNAVIKVILSGVIAYTIHYGSVKAYNTMCVPDTPYGFLQGFVTMGSPMCQLGLTLMRETQTSYSSIMLMGASRLLVDMVVPGTTTALPLEEGAKQG